MSQANGGLAKRISVSGPTDAPWIGILKTSLLWTAVPALAAACVALAGPGINGAFSVAAGWALIVLFFGISLLVGHVVGRKNPSGAIGMFAVTYAVKVVGFAAVLWMVGVPQWLERPWFAYAALGTVVIWQVAEIRAFSRTRQLIYSDAPAGAGKEVKGA